MGITTLFFNENPMPVRYTRGTIPAKELRLRAALAEVDRVHVISLPGRYIQTSDRRIGPLEKKVRVHLTIPWFYYGAGLLHFFYGIYYILKYKPDVLEAESGIISGPAVVLLGKIFGLPTLVELRASYEELIKVHAPLVPYGIKKYLLALVTAFSYSQATAIVANSKTYQKYLKLRGFEGVEINPGLQYAPTPPAKAKRQKVICFLGRLVDEKGVDDLLKAISLLKVEMVKAGFSVWIVGDGVRRVYLEQLARELGVDKLVKFKGSRPNYETLAQVSILVNPCFVKHPLEMVNVEAAWSRVPVICYGDRRVPETVVNGETGIKVPYRNIPALTRAIKQLMGNEVLRKRLVAAGKRFARTNYTFDLQVSRLRQLYARLGLEVRTRT